jgi:fibronectin type 3 domain-containing protein
MNVSSGRFSAGDPVVIYSFDSTNKNWVLEDTVFAASDGTVKFSIKHLSVWAAFKDDTPPPGRPSGIQASGADAKVTVQWTAPATGATSYNIYYNTASGVTPSNYLGKIENAVSPQDVTGLTNGTTYYFVVTAINTGGESGPSSEKSATPGSAPGTPTKVTVTAGSGQITVQWNTVTYATDYNIYYSSVYTTTDDLLVNGTRVSANALSADPQPTTQTQVIPSLTTGTTYYFIVTSQNAYGESGGQNTPKPLAPN